MGYVRNSAVRMLKHERSGIVGLVIPDIKNHFYSTVANAIAEAAAHSFQLILSTTDDLPDREFSAIRSLLELAVDRPFSESVAPRALQRFFVAPQAHA